MMIINVRRRKNNNVVDKHSPKIILLFLHLSHVYLTYSLCAFLSFQYSAYVSSVLHLPLARLLSPSVNSFVQGTLVY